ncbi:hypothetical protein JAAARDRAFT_57812 [Jaapia argillacea MUCL 33604]|uniref:Uncharacterized protein n=1 Tax=Jaapia argillacea MUCL 33604 TaxID=933084 RepID=A0A067Q3G0_9AGAM|nr:hypothetical protein JAAARDRAFT_57812 [Jaapia argillacea MUCL 33604]
MLWFQPILLLAAVSSAFTSPVDLKGRELPTPVPGATARLYLSQLTVAATSNSPAYSRDQFKAWNISASVWPSSVIDHFVC